MKILVDNAHRVETRGPTAEKMGRTGSASRWVMGHLRNNELKVTFNY